MCTIDGAAASKYTTENTEPTEYWDVSVIFVLSVVQIRGRRGRRPSIYGCGGFCAAGAGAACCWRWALGGNMPAARR